MKLTTGYDFQGYVITDYIDVIFDEMLVGMGIGKSFASTFDNLFSGILGEEATEMIGRLNEIKRTLRDRVEQKAALLGANALIGIDFESSKLGDLIMVSMTATAVKIEKLAEFVPLTVERKNAEEKKHESEEKGKRIQRLAQETNTDYVHGIEAFIEEAPNCRNFMEIKEVWNGLNLPKNDLTSDISKKIESSAHMERLYGGTTKEKIRDFISAVEKYLA